MFRDSINKEQNNMEPQRGEFPVLSIILSCINGIFSRVSQV